MSSKKEIRKNFRDVCLKRDKNTCKICGHKESSYESALNFFDIHHITDRSLMISGGYVLENGITLCKISCHEMAESFHATGKAIDGYAPEDLYKKINSSYEKAVEASKRL